MPWGAGGIPGVLRVWGVLSLLHQFFSFDLFGVSYVGWAIMACRRALQQFRFGFKVSVVFVSFLSILMVKNGPCLY